MSVEQRDEITIVVTGTGSDLNRDPCPVRQRLLEVNRTSRDEWVTACTKQGRFVLKSYDRHQDEETAEWISTVNPVDVGDRT